MKQEQADTGILFSTYEIMLNPYDRKDIQIITPEEFFK